MAIKEFTLGCFNYYSIL